MYEFFDVCLGLSSKVAFSCKNHAIGLCSVANTGILMLKIAGGIYLGVCIWRGAKRSLLIAEPNQVVSTTLRKSFLVALGAQLKKSEDGSCLR